MRNLMYNDRLKSLAKPIAGKQKRNFWSVLLPISGLATAIVSGTCPSLANLPPAQADSASTRSSSNLPTVSTSSSLVPNNSPFLSVVNQLTATPLLFSPQQDVNIGTGLNQSPLTALQADMPDSQLSYLAASIPNLPSDSEAFPSSQMASSLEEDVSTEQSIASPKTTDTAKQSANIFELDSSTGQTPVSKQFLENSLNLAESQLVLSQVIRFSDIQNHWAEGFIAALASRQIVVGFPDGTFRPDEAITRAQYAALLNRAFKLSSVRSGITFNDVSSDYWAADVIEAAYMKGFFQAKAGFFDPEQLLPRAQTLSILGDGLDYQVPSNPTQVLKVYFRDAEQVSSETEGLVAAAAANQVVVSYPDINFLNPNRTATRADAASFVHQALVNKGAIPPLDSDSLAASYIAGLKPTTSSSNFGSSSSNSGAPSTAQAPQTPSSGSIQSVKDRLRAYQEIDNFGNIFKGSPAITIANPPAYGADDFLFFATATYQSRTRFTQQSDGALGVGIGLFNALETVGLELSYTAASFGNSRSFGAGGFNAKLHRAFEGDWALAAGWNGFITVDDPFGDFSNSWYGSVTKIFRTADSIEDPFSRVAVTAGFGGGQFRPLRDVRNAAGVKIGNEPSSSVGVFGSVAVRVADPLTAIVEWTGQDLAVGLSVRPISDVNWTITPALRDLAGDGLDGTRFVLGTSFSIKF